jgi:hypothetical protein
MNKRIKELAEQAGVFAGDFAGAGIYSIHNKDEVEKFAELIIQECIQLKDPLVKHYIYSHAEQDQAFLLAALTDYSSEIKKHFGVE